MEDIVLKPNCGKPIIKKQNQNNNNNNNNNNGTNNNDIKSKEFVLRYCASNKSIPKYVEDSGYLLSYPLKLCEKLNGPYWYKIDKSKNTEPLRKIEIEISCNEKKIFDDIESYRKCYNDEQYNPIVNNDSETSYNNKYDNGKYDMSDESVNYWSDELQCPYLSSYDTMLQVYEEKYPPKEFVDYEPVNVIDYDSEDYDDQYNSYNPKYYD